MAKGGWEMNQMKKPRHGHVESHGRTNREYFEQQGGEMMTPRESDAIEIHDKLKRGDYVLTTKWSDGDPHDPFAIGFFAGMIHGNYLVGDSDGKLFNANGFRRIAKISPECGNWIVAHLNEIEQGDRSLWGIKRFWKRLSRTD